MTDNALPEQPRGNRKTRRGIVISKSGEKTLVVQVERRYSHPLYGKQLREFRKCHTHDEANRAQVGDRVRIAECRPLSRLKRWRLVEVEKAVQAAE